MERPSTTSSSSAASSAAAPPPKRTRTYRGRRRPVYDQAFSTYLSFGLSSTICVGCFLFLYLLVIIGLQPLLDYVPDPTSNPEMILAHPENFGQVTTALKNQIVAIRRNKGRREEMLMQAAKEQFEALRANKKRSLLIKSNQAAIISEVAAKQRAAAAAAGNNQKAAADKVVTSRPGFVVLGMHRSGTSMVSGLLVTGFGYKVGGPLIGAKFDNEKGFFERIDVVLQNDEFMSAQNIWWGAGVIRYDYKKALDDKKSGRIKFKEGDRGLEFLNDSSNSPWLQKDPRMCITLKTWLPLLDNEPAVLFTYRHPLEVAMSLKKREKDFPLETGLRLWIVYNMRAIQNSDGLCRVLSSNEAVLSDPLAEVQRIAKELTEKCKVPKPERELTKEDVAKFVDPQLQHNKNKREANQVQRKVLVEHDGCEVREYDTDLEKDSEPWKLERDFYLIAMKMYCDFQSGKAYKDDYGWPELQ